MDDKQHLRILNLGSGKRPIEGAVNVDINKDNPGVTVSFNIETRFPFFDNDFDEVVCYHILEHVHNLPFVMGEIWRVSKPGAIIKIDAPHWTNPTFWDDASHVRPWAEGTAKFLSEELFDGVRGYTGRFEIITNEVLGDAWSYERPTVCVVELKTIKEKS